MGINHLYSFLYPLKNKTDRSANNQNKMIKCIKGKVTKLFTFYITLVPQYIKYTMKPLLKFPCLYNYAC